MASSTGLLELLTTPETLSVVGCTAVVFGVQRLVPTYDMKWYRSLQKPSWTPPNWVFPAVWIPLKLMQSAALWLVWNNAKGKDLALPLTAFSVHMFLGNWWNVVFFGRNKLRESLPWMYTFWASIGATAAAFYPVSPIAAALMAPTQVWVTIAAKLNYDIVQLNLDKEKPGQK